ncbi:NUDIX hydrolase [Zhihengliuella salsuginis]|uniref:MutT/NUDIX-family protein n=1 Tax=Zhihengliuella salsuginis TaxID=578222 RepID=A0ABQ3GIE7_9MICC|nr:NUDIX domain-containing protein [Zhihengliuella salsuginis]GHD05602.1 putative MutT/NUDIX-family protein [Zhihengliuella salsuginis]
MPVPDFILRLRERIGTDPLWLPGVTAVVLRGAPAEVLLVRRSDNGQWTPVTGIVDPGEHPAHTAVREAAEETGVEIEVEELVWVGVTDPVVHVNGDQAQYLDHTFRCRYVSGQPYPADDESTDAGWFRLDDLPPMREIFRERIRTAAERTGSTRLD